MISTFLTAVAHLMVRCLQARRHLVPGVSLCRYYDSLTNWNQYRGFVYFTSLYLFIYLLYTKYKKKVLKEFDSSSKDSLVSFRFPIFASCHERGESDQSSKTRDKGLLSEKITKKKKKARTETTQKRNK